MLIHERRALGVLTSSLTLVLVVLLVAPSWAAEKARLHVDDYQIEADSDPHLHQIKAGQGPIHRAAGSERGSFRTA